MRLDEIKIDGYETLIMDRDGTINVHIIGDYVRKWEDFEFIPGVLEVMPKFAQHFKHIFIVTNQRGIGKGKYTDEDLADSHAHMKAEIEKVGGRIDDIYYCTAVDEADHNRKPNIGMFEQILREHPDVNPSKCIMLGDGDVDRDFAKNCGIAFAKVDSMKRKGDVKYWENEAGCFGLQEIDLRL